MQTMPDYHLDALFRSALAAEAEALALSAADEEQMLERVRQALTRRRSRRQIATLLIAAAVVSLTAGAIALATDRLRPPVTPEPAPTPRAVWTGPLRTDADGDVIAMTEYSGRYIDRDPEDAADPWADIAEVGRGISGPTYWNIEFAEPPPDWEEIDPAETVIAYGVVLETTGDGIADYVIGIDNDTPRQGDYRTWVTNVATGETDEQLGPPYGYPVEFVHPDEHREDPFMRFWFLPNSGPSGATGGAAGYYMWASVTQGDEVIAWDYAPDGAWLGNRPPPASASAEPEPLATPMLPALGLPGTGPGAPAKDYGWTGTFVGDIGGLHYVPEDGDQTQLTFAIGGDCFTDGTDTEPVPVTVAGFDGFYVEPYEGPDVILFGYPDDRGDPTTGAYALAIGDRTLCVYLTWYPNTTQDDLEAARRVVEDIRGQPFGDEGIRINFTLPAGWDTG
jgi:hypothetical protein